MTEPNLSSDFNMEDIRKIRDYNSARHAKMTQPEIIADFKFGANEMAKKLAERKEKTSFHKQ